MNLYQKYRPKDFDSVIGHDTVIKELKKRAKGDNFPQVIHITGRTGTGKTTLFRIIGKSILCLNKDKDGNSCNSCETCKAIDEEKISEMYHEYNGSNVGIDEMRTIEDLARMKVLSKSQKRVIVIDELQELSANKKAQKNILKVLERPLKSTYFILGSMDKTKVDKAINDRAVTYILKPLKFEHIAVRLKQIAEAEGVKVDVDKDKIETLLTLAENAKGSMRAGIAYLERAIFSDIWTTDKILEELGILSKEEINSIIEGMLSGDVEKALSHELNEEIIQLVRWKLFIMYKGLCGIKILNWEKGELSGISKYSIDKVKKALEAFLDLQRYPYMNNVLINYIVLSITESNMYEKLPEVNPDQIRSSTGEPIRRRRQE